MPALTTGDRNAYHKAREILTLASPENAASFTEVDSALFVVAIDVGANGLSAEDMSRNVLYGIEGTNYNRWMDKWNIIVCEDGQAGLNWEHSMLDGHTMMEYYAEVGKEYDVGAPVEADEVRSRSGSSGVSGGAGWCRVVPGGAAWLRNDAF